jgi:hypothetical protein
MATSGKAKAQRAKRTPTRAGESAWLAVDAAAAYCAVGPKCIRRMALSGEIRSRKFGRYLRIWRASLQPDAPEAATSKAVLGLAKTGTK